MVGGLGGPGGLGGGGASAPTSFAAAALPPPPLHRSATSVCVLHLTPSPVAVLRIPSKQRAARVPNLRRRPAVACGAVEASVRTAVGIRTRAHTQTRAARAAGGTPPSRGPGITLAARTRNGAGGALLRRRRCSCCLRV